MTSFIGIAGEPPPEPTSMMLEAAAGTCLAAATGSSKSLSIASSWLSSDVRLILRFQRDRSS